MNATGDVKAGAVPGADNLGADQVAFRQRTAAMRTAIVNGVKGAADVEQGQGTAADLDLLPFSRGHFLNSGHRSERHGCFSKGGWLGPAQVYSDGVFRPRQRKLTDPAS